MKIYWGRYEGEEISRIPFHYLKWLAQKFPAEEVGKAADIECQCRDAVKGKGGSYCLK